MMRMKNDRLTWLLLNIYIKEIYILLRGTINKVVTLLFFLPIYLILSATYVPTNAIVDSLTENNLF